MDDFFLYCARVVKEKQVGLAEISVEPYNNASRQQTGITVRKYSEVVHDTYTTRVEKFSFGLHCWPPCPRLSLGANNFIMLCKSIYEGAF